MGLNLLLVVAMLAVGGSLVAVVIAAGWGASEPTGVARSLAIIEQRIEAHEVAKSELPLMDRLILPMLGRTRSIAFRLSPTGAADRMTKRLDLAGNPKSWTAERVMGAKGAGLLLGGLLGGVYGGLGLKGLMFALVGGAVGFFVPDLLLYNVGLKRQEELRRGMADALDMLTVCVEAGQGFDGALLQVARSVTGPISGEFARVLAEIQIGRSRSDAFALMAERTTAHEVKTFVSSLVQADRLGLPIASVLREQSNQMRLIRRQRAEEKAQKVPVKIIFPLLLCIFPALFIVIIGPGAIRMIDTFSGM